MEEKTRDQIDSRYKWVLEDIYPSDEAWEADYKKLEGLFSEIPHIRKTLTKDEKRQWTSMCVLEARFRL